MELTNESNHSFRSWLRAQFTRRCQRNRAYSLRAFARDLEMDPSSLSQILAGKRRPSRKAMLAIGQRLEATVEQLDSFGTNSPDDFRTLALDAFTIVADWYHFAILELTYTASFRYDGPTVARQFGITETEASEALERLVRVGLLAQNPDGTWGKSTRFLTLFTPGQTSPALKELQRQVISLALRAVDTVPQEEKDITSMTMAIDVDRLPEARQLITKFRRDLSAFLEDGEQTRVYHLGIQLYPVSQNEEPV